MNDYPEQKPPSPHQAPPPNYLVWSILTTILCCLPFGIVSIVYAAQVNSKWQTGDYEGARLSSKNARLWAFIAFGIGLAGALLWSLLALLGVLGGIGMNAFETWG
jgi:hypothetical protein